jgi:hypothetical protein
MKNMKNMKIKIKIKKKFNKNFIIEKCIVY